jgi:hypothetical protein
LARMRDLSKEGPFGRLVAIRNVGRKYGKNFYWLCRCECGNEIEVSGGNLVYGSVKSCGCLRRENNTEKARQFSWKLKTHGLSYYPLFSAWYGMMRRCYNKKDKKFSWYGGKGITVCERWHDPQKFIDDMGDRPEGMTLDRKNSDLGYFPENCRWATQRTQHNNRNCTIILELDGESKSLADWADITGMNQSTIYYRKKILGWNDRDSLKTPLRKPRKDGDS